MYSDENDKAFAKVMFWGVVAIIGIVLGLITLFSAMRTVDTGKVGVVTSYGNVTGRELTDGFSWVAPWGANNVTEYDIKTQKVESTAPAATKDLQDVKATIVLTYTLNAGKVSEIHKEVGKNYQAIDIDPQVIEGFKAVSAKFTASELITNRADVKKQVVENIKGTVEKNGRYTIQDVAITNFAFSEGFNTAIEQTQVAQQEVLKARQELERVRVQAEKDIAAAQGQAEAQRLQLQTLTPELLRKLELENQRAAIEKWNGVSPQYQGSGANFYIPVGQ